MPTFTFDPRDLIFPPFSLCAACGREALGILSVGSQRVTRRCRECLATASEALPAVDKKVIYLDQFVLSNVTKSLSASLRNHSKARQRGIELNEVAFGFLRQACVRSDAARRSNDDEPAKPFSFSYWYVAKRWAAIRNAAGFTGLRIHDLRHSFVSNQLAAGTPIHVVPDMAAHRSLAVTALYAHHTDEARRAAAQRVQISVGAKAEAAADSGASDQPVRAPAAHQTDDRFDTNSDTKLNAASRNFARSLVGHLGFEPRANGLRNVYDADTAREAWQGAEVTWACPAARGHWMRDPDAISDQNCHQRVRRGHLRGRLSGLV
jgi:hypothetical protein